MGRRQRQTRRGRGSSNNAPIYQRNVQINDITRQHSTRSLYGAPLHDKVNQMLIEEAAYDIEITPNDKGGSFGDQFLATLERTVQQKKRDVQSTLLELTIPLLFVVLTIILWAAFGNEKFAEKSMLNYTQLTSAVIPTYYQNVLCNNQSMGIIPNLVPCTTVGFPVSCEGDESSLPLKGLCYNAQLTGPAIIAMFLNSLLGNAAIVPPLDTIIIYQWLARKTMGSGDAATATLTTSGLTANTRYNAITASGKLYFAPKANVPAGLIDHFNQSSTYFNDIYGGIFDTQEAANAHVKSGKAYNWAVIEIKSYTADAFDIEIHMNSSALPSLTKVVNLGYSGGFEFDHGEMYIASGFSSIQKLVYEHFLKSVVGFDPTLMQPYLAAFGSMKYTNERLLDSAESLVAFVLVLSFLYPVSQLSKKIVLEKELRIREAMLIMGLNNAALYLAWFVIYALQYLVECIVMVVMLKATFVTSSDAYVLFLLFFLFALTTIPLSGLIAAFFSKARLVSMLAPLIFFVMAVPVFTFTSASPNVIIGVSVLSPTAFATALSNIFDIETGTGFSASSFHNRWFNPKAFIPYIMLAADFGAYYILMFYLDAVLPKDWGTTKHPLFFIIDPIKAIARCGRSKEVRKGTNADGRAEDGVFEDVDFEDAAVRIEGLRKVYKRGGKKFAAVNNLYWGMMPKEISVLLGHNGAGKSTVMNMMTGMIEPDEGDCYIVNYSVRDDLHRVRQQIGFCPQHNILWPELTCREHLEFFGKIKSLSGPTLEEAVRIILKEVDLLDKIDYPSKDLSGGQKRKLSVAIAFVGRSPLVFLDEPTAGMDVGARRYTWELLRRMSQQHTIMLTTHYMDEADLLGHRIGIMSQGRLKCSGSSMFLKSRLGVGYNMSVSIDPDADAEAIDRLVISLVASAEASSYNGCEIVYRLPMKDVSSFPHLLAGMENEGEGFGIRGYSLSATTLEEVFLQIAVDDIYKNKDQKDEDEQDEAIKAEDQLVWHCEMVDKNHSKLWSQFKAMLVKRFWNALRDRRMQCFQIVCPVACIMLAMLLTLVRFTSTGSILLTPKMFEEELQMEVSNCNGWYGTINSSTSDDGTLRFDHNFQTAVDMSLYTIDTSKSLVEPRYSSIFCNDPGLTSAAGSTVGASVLFYNTSAFHAAGMVVAQFYEFAWQHVTGNYSNVLNTVASTMPESASDKKMLGGVQTILIGAIVMIPFTFLPSNPVAWVVKERECKARHLQNVSGLSFYIYWITNFLFDIVAYIITMFLVIIIFLIFSRKEYVSKETVGPTILMFLDYGFCSTVAAYALGFAFSEHSTAQTVTMAVSFVSGFLLVMMVFILSLVDFTEEASRHMRWAFRVVPSFCVGESVINLATNYQSSQLGLGVSAWDMGIVGWPCVYMAAEFPFFVLLTLFIDHPRRRMWGQRGSYHRSAPAELVDDEDSDVEDERVAVYEQESQEVNEDVIRVVDLRKVYSNGKVAVRNLTFSILPGEVFGFLGTNGAGKTTAISMLCQEFIPTSGSAYVCGYDVVSQSMEALQCIGYCPQFDATLDLLTVEEHLQLYAGIRGILYEQRGGVVRGLMRLCELSAYRSTVASELSGGNRRKLSVALSLIGSPQIVFLDEPSAGMDPVARRGLWTAIQKVSQNCSVVLTTHHLEEVEALADTVAIMADGALRCIGDKIHLKNKYGSGFEMSIRVESKHRRDDISRFVQENFPDATLNEFKGQRFVYALPADTQLSVAFAVLQQNKERLGITDYSVSQTSIEQVFLRISEEQEQRMAFENPDDVQFTQSHARLHHYKSSSGRVPKHQEEKPPELKVNVSSQALESYRRRQELAEAKEKELESFTGDTALGLSRGNESSQTIPARIRSRGSMRSNNSRPKKRKAKRRASESTSNVFEPSNGYDNYGNAPATADSGYGNAGYNDDMYNYMYADDPAADADSAAIPMNADPYGANTGGGTTDAYGYPVAPEEPGDSVVPFDGGYSNQRAYDPYTNNAVSFNDAYANTDPSDNYYQYQAPQPTDAYSNAYNSHPPNPYEDYAM